MKPKISTRRVFEAAIWMAAGLPVEVEKQACSPRCFMMTSDTQEARGLLEAFNAGETLSIPHKAITDAYHLIISRCKSLQSGRIGGVEG